MFLLSYKNSTGNINTGRNLTAFWTIELALQLTIHFVVDIAREYLWLITLLISAKAKDNQNRTIEELECKMIFYESYLNYSLIELTFLVCLWVPHPLLYAYHLLIPRPAQSHDQGATARFWSNLINEIVLSGRWRWK